MNEAFPKYDLEFDHELEKRAIFTIAVVAISTIIGGLAVAGVTMATENIARMKQTELWQLKPGSGRNKTTTT